VVFIHVLQGCVLLIAESNVAEKDTSNAVREFYNGLHTAGKRIVPAMKISKLVANLAEPPLLFDYELDLSWRHSPVPLMNSIMACANRDIPQRAALTKADSRAKAKAPSRKYSANVIRL
jgi:hypothetical protein